MATSYNGWLASKNPADFGGLQKLIVGTEAFSPGVRAGNVHTVLEYVATQINNRVERADFGHSADDWGYAFRANLNNPSQLSCHASGTAIDYNATRHPNGRGGTWTTKQKNEILAILRDIDNVVRCLWGYDEMHFEICANAERVAAAAEKIRRGQSQFRKINIGEPTELNTEGEQVRTDQWALNDKGFTLEVDGFAGPDTVRRIVDFQYAAGLELDGAMGPVTREKINLVPSWNNGAHTAAEWQQRIQALGFNINVDDEWGPASADTLKEFQLKARIDVTGERTYQAWSALFCY